MIDIPEYLQDSKELLSEEGFAIQSSWYHGTSSALLDAIQENGLKRSGDKAMKQVAKSTMATIGNKYTESMEPVFLTQSKALAFYWAQQTVRERSVRFEGAEEPVVIQLNLPESMQKKVKPDVGAMSLLLLEEGEKYVAFIAKLNQDLGLPAFSIDLKGADRMAYLTQLGMAYIDQDIDANLLSVVRA